MTVKHAKDFLASLIREDGDLHRLFSIAYMYGYTMKIDLVKEKKK